MGHWASLVGVLALVLSTRTSAEDGQWPRFRGPGGAGISDTTTIPVQWTEKDYNWKVKLPGVGHSSPVVWEKRVYVTCGERETAKRTVLCLDTADGHALWRRDHPSRTFQQNPENSYATATPAADAEGVVVTWTTPDEVTLLALDLEGQEVWRRSLGPFVSMHGTGSSPVIMGDVVVLSNEQGDLGTMNRPAGSAPKSFVIGVERKTGQTRWQLSRRSALAVYATPCVRQGDGGRTELVFTSTSHGFTAVDPASGKVLWESDDVLKECVGSAVVAPGLVLSGDAFQMRGGHFVAVRPPSGEQGAKATVAYEIQKPVPRVPTALVKDGRLFLWYDDGNVACHNVLTGQLLWRERAGGQFYGSPVCVNNRLYCIAKNGDVVVLAASDKYEPLARVPLGEPSFATPAVAHGVMYLRTRSQLFSLGGKAP